MLHSGLIRLIISGWFISIHLSLHLSLNLPSDGPEWVLPSTTTMNQVGYSTINNITALFNWSFLGSCYYLSTKQRLLITRLLTMSWLLLALLFSLLLASATASNRGKAFIKLPTHHISRYEALYWSLSILQTQSITSKWLPCYGKNTHSAHL